MYQKPYKDLADRLNSTPNGFPPTDDGTELRLLEKLYTPLEGSNCLTAAPYTRNN